MESEHLETLRPQKFHVQKVCRIKGALCRTIKYLPHRMFVPSISKSVLLYVKRKRNKRLEFQFTLVCKSILRTLQNFSHK